MASRKIENTVLAGTIVLVAVTGTMALVRIVNNPALLYVAGQVQIATGHRDNGLSLISRAASSTSAENEPAMKPSPAMPATSKCPPTQVKAVHAAPKTVAPAQKNIAMVEDPGEVFYFQNVSTKIPTAPMLVKFNVPPAASPKIATEEINRRVQVMQKRINRQVQKAVAGSRLPAAG